MLTTIRIGAYNPGPLTGAGNNTYLLVGAGGEAALVDAGIGEPRHLEELDAALGARHARLASVLVTHAHSDHVAGAPALAAANPSARFWKYPWPEEDPKWAVRWHPLADCEVAQAGGEPLTALHTPGHSPDHLAFWHEPTRTLFAGDLVIPGASVTINVTRGGDLTVYLQSLQRMIALEPERLLPAHGEPVDKPLAVLTRHFEHRLTREQQILDLLAGGPRTVESVADSIYDGISPALMPAARHNVRAHLARLAAGGHALEHDGRWLLQRAR